MDSGGLFPVSTPSVAKLPASWHVESMFKNPPWVLTKQSTSSLLGSPVILATTVEYPRPAVPEAEPTGSRPADTTAAQSFVGILMSCR